jgi:predicted nucleic acid-binding protein
MGGRYRRHAAEPFSRLVVTASFVDSSVLIDHLRGTPTPQVIELRQRLGVSELVIGDLVLMEVLQGLRHPDAFRAVDQVLRSFPCADLVGRRRARAGAFAYHELRRRGVTPRSSIDVLIACFCVEANLELLSSDRDHRLMVPILGLRLWEPPLN